MFYQDLISVSEEEDRKALLQILFEQEGLQCSLEGSWGGNVSNAMRKGIPNLWRRTTIYRTSNLSIGLCIPVCPTIPVR